MYAVVFAAACVMLAGAGPRAQSGAAAPASFSGTLTDTFGRELPNAPIALTNTATADRRTGRSDGQGRFTFAGLEAGTYDLNAQVPGFTSRYRIVLRPGQNATRDVTLQVGSLQETVTVSSASSSQPRQVRDVDPQVFEHRSDPCGPDARGCLEPPLKVRDVRPVYPASRVDASAVVRLVARIGVDGFVHDVRLAAPADRDFAAAATEAVGQWLFTPTRLNGVPVEVEIAVAINFKAE